MELPAVEQRYRPHGARHRFVRGVFRAPVWLRIDRRSFAAGYGRFMNANPSIELNHKNMNGRLTPMRKVHDASHYIVVRPDRDDRGDGKSCLPVDVQSLRRRVRHPRLVMRAGVRAHLVTSRPCRRNSRFSISPHCRDRTRLRSGLNDMPPHGIPPCVAACPRLQPARRRSWTRLDRQASRQGWRHVTLHQRRLQGSETCPPQLSNPPPDGGSL
jgi:hypothetical protein